MIALGNKIYVGLGDDLTGDVNDWWMYDIALDSWSQIGNLPGPGRHHPFMFSVNGRAFAGLGHSGSTIFGDWYELDTLNQSWTRVNDFPGETRVAGTQFSAGNKGFVLSGDGSNHSFMPTGEMWSYTPETDTWEQETPHPGISLWAPGSFVIDDEVYFFGGQNRANGSFPTSLHKFDLSGIVSSVNGPELTVLNVFPNPTQNVINWNANENITTVQIYNTVGQLVLTQNVNTNQINVGGLANGMYFLELLEGSTPVAKSLIQVQH
jgi:N-acetylneuraminic acid mutarotase